MRLTANISAQEVIPKEYWNRYGSSSIRLMDMRIIEANQKIRARQGSSRFFNTWNVSHWSKRNESGLRIPEHKHYNALSQHSYGRALDSISDAVPHEETWQDILDNPAWYWNAGITVVESINVADSWLHTDCRDFDYQGNRITELMIAEKENGRWVMHPVVAWKNIHAKETGRSFAI